MIVKTFQKDPAAIREYGLEWKEGLTDPIVASAWTVPTGIVNQADDFTASVATIIVSGGTLDQDYELLNHVTFTSGQEDERSILIQVRNVESSPTYCDLSEVRAMAQGMTPDGEPPAGDDLVAAIIERVSRMFDLEVGVPEGYFNRSIQAAASSRTIYGDGTNYLKLDPYVAGSLNTTVTMPDGYTVPSFIERGGYLIAGTNGNLPVRGFQNGLWLEGVPVTITAKWGFFETPADVKHAVIEWSINVWRETDPASLRLINLEGGVLRESVPPRTREVINQWRMKVGGLF